MARTILIYASEPDSIIHLTRFIRTLKEGGFFIHGLFENNYSISKQVTNAFDSFETLTQETIDEVVKTHNKQGHRVVVVCDIINSKIYETLLLNFNVATFLFDTRYHSWWAWLGKSFINLFKSEIMKRKVLRLNHKALLYESDLIICTSSFIQKKFVTSKYKGELVRFHYTSVFEGKRAALVRKDKMYLYIPAVFDNEKLILKCLKVLEEFKSVIQIVIKDNEREAYLLRDYVSSHHLQNFIQFSSKELDEYGMLVQSDVVFIPHYEAHPYLQYVVDAMAVGRMILGFEGSAVEDYAPNDLCSVLVERNDSEGLVLTMNRLLINNYLINTMGNECFNVYKVKYNTNDFISKTKQLIDKYNR